MLLEPLFEHREIPDQYAVVVRILLVVQRAQLIQEIRPDDPSVKQVCQIVIDQLGQARRTLQPETKWEPEAMLRLVDDFGRQEINHGILEEGP